MIELIALVAVILFVSQSQVDLLAADPKPLATRVKVGLLAIAVAFILYVTLT